MGTTASADCDGRSLYTNARTSSPTIQPRHPPPTDLGLEQRAFLQRFLLLFLFYFRPPSARVVHGKVRSDV